ncbi:MAG: hypothetical protein IJO01_05205 [Oscillospiraceae bacterium]|nr:hypothetical protein [Oscillospiraceae bacterium]
MNNKIYGEALFPALRLLFLQIFEKSFKKHILPIDFIVVKCYYDTTVKQTEAKTMTAIWQNPSEVKRHRH